MNIFNDLRQSRTALYNSFRSLGITPRLPTGATGRGNLTGITADSFFQQTPMSYGDAANIYGSKEEFMENFGRFQKEFQAMLGDRTNIAYGRSGDVRMMKTLGIMDFSVFTQEARQIIEDRFMNNVLKVNELIQRQGLPGSSLPSANLYRSLFKFRTISSSSEGFHPAQVLLNTINFFHDPSKEGLSSLKAGSKIVDPSRLQQLVTPFSSMGIEAGQKVVTLDVETTGVFRGSQARSFGAAEMVMTAEGLGDVRTLGDVGFAYASPQMAGMTAQLNGETLKMSEFISRIEGTGAPKTNPEDFLKSADDFLKRVMEADVVAGHNIGFDLGKIFTTIQETEGFEKHSIVKTMDEFHSRVAQNKIKVLDTAEVARSYLLDQFEQSIARVPGLDVDARTASFVQTLFSQENLATLKVGGKATYAGVTDIASNTNLFELLESKGLAGQLFDAITGGSHIAETDTILQSHIMRYIQTGELRLRGIGNADGSVIEATEFGEFARRKIQKSAALTPTTNIADVSHLTKTVRDYVSTERGMQGVILNLGTSDIEMLTGTSAERGVLRFAGDRFQVMLPGVDDFLDVDTGQAQSYIQDVIRRSQLSAAEDPLSISVRIGAGSETRTINRAANQIVSLGVSYGTQSKLKEMEAIDTTIRSTLSAGIPTAEKDAKILESLGSMYQKFGTTLTDKDRSAAFMGKMPQGVPFQTGVNEYDMSTAGNVARIFAEAGDPMAFLDVRSRAFSTILASGTAGFGEAVGETLVRQGVFEAADITANARLAAEGGVSYFSTSTTANMFRNISATSTVTDAAQMSAQMSARRMQVPTQVFREALTGIAEDVNNIGNITLSQMNIQDETKKMLKLVYNPLDDLGSDKSRSLAERLFNIMSDENEIARLMKTDINDLHESVTKTVSQLGALRSQMGNDDIIDIIHESIRTNGLIFAETRVDNSVIEMLAKNGFDFQNDVTINNMRGRVVATGVDQLDNAAVIVSGFADRDTLLIQGAEEQFINASREKIEYTKSVSRVISENKRDVARKIRKSMIFTGENKLLEAYEKVRPKFGLAGIALAAAGTGYYLAKRNREMDLYNETLEAQPYEIGTNFAEDDSARARFVESSTLRKDPLLTAGVVGNLDRSKIGHHQMGSRKYDHLFGG